MNEIIVPLAIPANALWAVAGISMLFFLIMSVVYAYHWQYYGIAGNHKVFAKSLYFVIGILLFIAMIIFLSAYAYA